MVFVCGGPLRKPNTRYRVYLNQDGHHKETRFYLRVTHILESGCRNFRAGTYKSKEAALEALKSIDPENPKKAKRKAGSIDLYSNGSWRVRAKFKNEILHIGYFKTKEIAEQKLKEVQEDPAMLHRRYDSLLKKRAERKSRVLKRSLEDEYYANAAKKQKTEPSGLYLAKMEPPLDIPRLNAYDNSLRQWAQENLSLTQLSSMPLYPPTPVYTPAPEPNWFLVMKLDANLHYIAIPPYLKSVSYQDLKDLVLSQDPDLYFQMLSRDLHYIEEDGRVQLLDNITVKYSTGEQRIVLF